MGQIRLAVGMRRPSCSARFPRPARLMRALLFVSLVFIPALHALAEQAVVHRIEADGKYHDAGRPAAGPRLLAVAGKPLRLRWGGNSAGTASPLRVERITAARRIPVETGEAAAEGEGWTWQWTPPITRSVVFYEIRLEAKPDTPVRIEVRDPEWLKGLREKLPLMTWEAAGLDRKEIAALQELGLRRIASSARTAGTAVQLRVISNEPGSPRRQVTWDADHHDLVVWRPGVANGDLDIRAPRWWISPEALATDQGLIRFLDLFSEPPVNP